MRISRCVMLVVAVLATVAAHPVAPAVAATGAGGGRSRSVVLHPRFRMVATGVRQLQQDGNDVFLDPDPAGATQSAGILINGHTGQRTTLSAPPGCLEPVVGGGWLTFNAAAGGPGASPPTDCLSELYPLAGGPPGSPTPFPAHGAVAAIGSQWIEYTDNCDTVHLCPSEVFANLHTGSVRTNPTNAHTIPDLDAPGLAQHVCAPLTVPRTAALLPDTDWLVFHGRFAVATGWGTIYLERCGSSLHRRVLATPGSVAGNTSAIIWPGPGRALQGLFLPSLRSFTLQAPVANPELVLTSKTLYLLGQTGRVWSAPAPTAPRSGG